MPYNNNYHQTKPVHVTIRHGPEAEHISPSTIRWLTVTNETTTPHQHTQLDALFALHTIILEVISFCITQNDFGSDLFQHYTERFWKRPLFALHRTVLEVTSPGCTCTLMCWSKKTAHLLHFFQQVLNEGGTRSHCYLHLVSSIQDLHTSVVMRLKPVKWGEEDN